MLHCLYPEYDFGLAIDTEAGWVYPVYRPCERESFAEVEVVPGTGTGDSYWRVGRHRVAAWDVQRAIYELLDKPAARKDRRKERAG